jgi:esterase/lipase superfamily enzyme
MVVLAMLTACAQRGIIEVVPEAAAVGDVQTILVASSRDPSADGVGFSAKPGAGLSFAEFAVSVPPDRKPGTVTLPGPGAPDARKDFLVVGATRIADRSAFIRAVNATVARQPPGQRDAFVFVHGFNTNFAEGLFRQAQMRKDFDTRAVSVQYSWPSAGSVRAYATDREAALLVRDDLEDLIALLNRTNVSRIVLLGHSMGAFIVMETVRQIAIRDGRRGFAKLQAVVLMAPDIDVNVFRNQARDLAASDLPVYVFTSSRDRALWLSAVLRGTPDRLGSISDPARVADLPVTIIDLTDLETQRSALNHFKVATSYTLISLFRGMSNFGAEIFREETRNPGLFSASLEAVQGIGAVTFRPTTAAP